MTTVQLVLVLLAIVFFFLQWANVPKYQWGWGGVGLMVVALVLLPRLGG